jgi:hypothetical protein
VPLSRGRRNDSGVDGSRGDTTDRPNAVLNVARRRWHLCVLT